MKLECIKDLVMEDNGEIAAIAGKTYEINCFIDDNEKSYYFTDEQNDSKHYMTKEDMVEYFYFVLKDLQDLEYIRQGFADVLDLLIPYLPENQRTVAILSYESYHKFVDDKIVEIGGESVNRVYSKGEIIE